MVISDPPNTDNFKDEVWGIWLAELRNHLSDLGLDVPPAEFGAGVTNQSWIDYAAQLSKEINGAPPVPVGIPMTSPVWKSWYTDISNILNT